MKLRGFWGWVTLVLALVLAGGLRAEDGERITSFTSEITIAANGDLELREVIEVEARGDQIQRGIYRDFPLLFEQDGQLRRVEFNLRAVRRDGDPEAYSTERNDRAVRVWIGSPVQFLPPGRYSYELHYTTDRQLRFYDDHDEIYWNTTGNAWLFPIDTARQIILLPKSAQIEGVDVFTGPLGATDKKARLVAQQDTPAGLRLEFETTAPLGPEEGMTVAIALAKGALPAPTAAQRADWQERDSAGTGLGIALAIGIWLYYLLVWWMWGRDLRPGIIIPRWEPMAQVSAALTRTIWNRGALEPARAMALVAVELAVKRLIDIRGDGALPVFIRTKAERPARLPAEQTTMLQAIERAEGRLEIGPKESGLILQLKENIGAQISKRYRNPPHFTWNIALRFLGGALVVLALFVLINEVPPLVAGPLFGYVLIAVPVVLAVVPLMRQREPGDRLGVAHWVFLAVGLLIFLPLALLVGRAVFKTGGDPRLLIVVPAMLVAPVLMGPLLSRVTPLGRGRLDHIAGMVEYIAIAEADRLNLPGVPDMSTEHFEQILPYAMALDLETPWVSRFETWLAAVGPQGGPHPRVEGRELFPDVRPAAAPAHRDSPLHAAHVTALGNSLTAALPVAVASAIFLRNQEAAARAAEGGSSCGSSSSSSSSGGGGGGGGGGGW